MELPASFCPWCNGVHQVSAPKILTARHGRKWTIGRFRCARFDKTIFFAKPMEAPVQTFHPEQT